MSFATSTCRTSPRWFCVSLRRVIIPRSGREREGVEGEPVQAVGVVEQQLGPEEGGEHPAADHGPEPDDDGVPPALHALADLQHDSWLPRWGEGRLRWHPPPRGRRARQRRATAAGVPGAVASCRLSTALGAPLADILQTVAGGVAESGRAEASRRAALAGPRSTARLLACLPVVGLGLGMLVGADPASQLYVGMKHRESEAIGMNSIQVELPAESTLFLKTKMSPSTPSSARRRVASCTASARVETALWPKKLSPRAASAGFTGMMV